MRLAEEADQSALPEELKRREARLSTIEHAKNEVQKRAQRRFEREQVEYD